MRRQFFDVEHDQAVFGQHALRGRKRKIRKMLVINGVELVVTHELEQVGEFNRHASRGLEGVAEPFYEVVNVRNMRKYVVGNQQVRRLTGCA